jgi:glycerol-3-phosphate acyltransferase PlsX
VDCSAEYLLQFAYMGAFYSKNVLGCENPRVALLNIGAEDTKGGELQKEAYALLTAAHEAGRINFVGNTEARDVFSGDFDVLVADGFSGNVLLKGIEGTASTLMKELKAIFYKNLTTKLAAALLKKDLMSLRSKFDSSEVGGTVLLGICRPVIKAHGSSDAHAIRSAVRQAIDVVNADVIGKIEKNVQYMRIITTNEGES